MRDWKCGEVKRYEIHPDPDRLRRYDVTLDQLEKAIADSNMNAGGDYLVQPQSVQVVRGPVSYTHLRAHET